MKYRLLGHKSKFLTIIVAVLAAAVAIFFEERRIDALVRESSVWAEVLHAMRDTNTGVLVVRVGDDRIDKANPEAEKIFGYEPDGMFGLPVSELIPKELLPDHERSYSKTMESASSSALKERVIPISCMAKRRDGSEVPLIIRLYIGKNGVVALVNQLDESRYIPRDGMGLLVPKVSN